MILSSQNIETMFSFKHIPGRQVDNVVFKEFSYSEPVAVFPDVKNELNQLMCFALVGGKSPIVNVDGMRDVDESSPHFYRLRRKLKRYGYKINLDI
jgi:hypothetical protein